MDKMFTVKMMFEECKRLIANGYGDKKLLVTDDEEGNGYHALYYQATTIKNDLQYYIDEGMIAEARGMNPLTVDDFIIIG